MNTATPLPTRVNRACDRCRRNKSRCDSYRPCSLCLRASATCTNTDPKSSGSRSSVAAENSDGRSTSERGTKRRRLTPTSNAEGSDPERRVQERQPRSHPEDRASASPDGSQSFRDGGTDSAISIARKIHTLERRHTYEHLIDAIPGADTSPALDSTAGEAEPEKWASTSLYLTHPLPDQTTLEILMSEYFHSIHWFSLIILEQNLHPMWNNARSGFASPSDKPFLLLLSVMLGVAALYKKQRTATVDDPAHQYWKDMSRKLIANGETQLPYIMDQRSVIAIQTLILLGSFYVYNGRPNLSFALLGATVKAAQSLGLHQKSSQGSFEDIEERKRVWWTIYTWDRFASVNYGRPLGISENGFSVEMPEDIHESPRAMLMDSREPHEKICYSPYQRELNRVYRIASPAIESIYAAAGDHHRKAKEYYALVIDVTKRLWRWRRELPQHLQLCLDVDWPVQMRAADRAYRLQALSLYITFDSLVLVLHRPFIKQRLDSVLVGSPEHAFQRSSNPRPAGSATDSDAWPSPAGDEGSAEDTSNHEHLWNAAVRTARIAEWPQLAQQAHHATDGHLVQFVGLNLFNASVVLVVMALSNPLSDRAQEAKRAVARIYRVLTTLADRSTLSLQTSGVLRSLIQLLITRESDAIFLPTTGEPINQINSSVQDAADQPLVPTGGDVVHAVQSGTQGLQQGLESVQRAFDTSETFETDGPGRSSRASISNEFNQRPPGSLEQPNPPEPLDQNRVFFDWREIDDNGMHWIWDPAWDNIFTGMNS